MYIHVGVKIRGKNYRNIFENLNLGTRKLKTQLSREVKHLSPIDFNWRLTHLLPSGLLAGL